MSLVTKIFLMVCFCTLSYSLPVVILVHGSFASTSNWPQPDGPFFKEIENQATQLNHKTVTFCWSGIPTDLEIIKGGKMLAQLIMSYPETEKIILIGHSHGGNVITVASQLLYKITHHSTTSQENTINQIFLEFPSTVLEQRPEWTTTHRSTVAQPGTKEFITLMEESVHELLRKYGYFLTRNSRPLSININAYLLGTPVDMSRFWPHMEIINTLILLYSDGDSIQSVLGTFQKHYPTHQRRSNLKVKLHLAPNHTSAPSHTDLHHTLIGRWLLCIPQVLSTMKVGNFDNFKLGVDGEVTFYPHQHPIYLP